MTLRTESRNRIGSNVHEVWAYVREVGPWIQRVSDREMAAIKAAVKPSTRGCVEL